MFCFWWCVSVSHSNSVWASLTKMVWGMFNKERSLVDNTKTADRTLTFVSNFPCPVCTVATISANQWKTCGSYSGEFFSALNVQLCWGPVCVKKALQPVCLSEEETARSHKGWGLDCRTRYWITALAFWVLALWQMRTFKVPLVRHWFSIPRQAWEELSQCNRYQ